MPKNVNYQSSSNTFYITINGKKIAVSEEVYRTVKRADWRENKRQERSKKCRGKNGSRCTADCTHCPFYMDGKNGGTVSLDGLAADGYDLPDSNDLEEAVMYSLLLEKLFEELAALSPTEQLILRAVGYDKSEREISDILKQESNSNPEIKPLSQKSVNLYKKRLFSLLKERLEDYR